MTLPREKPNKHSDTGSQCSGSLSVPMILSIFGRTFLSLRDKAAAMSDVRYTADEVFSRVRKGIHGQQAI